MKNRQRIDSYQLAATAFVAGVAFYWLVAGLAYLGDKKDHIYSHARTYHHFGLADLWFNGSIWFMGAIIIVWGAAAIFLWKMHTDR